MSLALSLIKRIESLGYAVSVHRRGECVELHAVPMRGDAEGVHVARSCEGDDDAQMYSVACVLAQMVGIEAGGG